jgi:hypothetical protein
MAKKQNSSNKLPSKILKLNKDYFIQLSSKNGFNVVIKDDFSLKLSEDVADVLDQGFKQLELVIMVRECGSFPSCGRKKPDETV